MSTTFGIKDKELYIKGFAEIENLSDTIYYLLDQKVIVDSKELN